MSLDVSMRTQHQQESPAPFSRGRTSEMDGLVALQKDAWESGNRGGT